MDAFELTRECLLGAADGSPSAQDLEDSSRALARDLLDGGPSLRQLAWDVVAAAGMSIAEDRQVPGEVRERAHRLVALTQANLALAAI